MNWTSLAETIFVTNKKYLTVFPSGDLYSYQSTSAETVLFDRYEGLSSHFVQIDRANNRWMNVNSFSQVLPFIIEELYQTIDLATVQGLLDQTAKFTDVYALSTATITAEKYDIPSTHFITTCDWMAEDSDPPTPDLTWLPDLLVVPLSLPDVTLIFITTRDLFATTLQTFCEQEDDYELDSLVSPFINVCLHQDHTILINQLSQADYASIVQVIQQERDSLKSKTQMLSGLDFPEQNPGALNKRPLVEDIEAMIIAAEKRHTISFFQTLFTYEIDIAQLLDKEEKYAAARLLYSYASLQKKYQFAPNDRKHIEGALNTLDLGIGLCETSEQKTNFIYSKAICLLIKISMDKARGISLRYQDFSPDTNNIFDLPLELDQNDLELLQKSKELFLETTHPIQKWSGLALINMILGMDQQRPVFIQEAIAQYDECLKFTSEGSISEDIIKYNRSLALKQLPLNDPIFPVRPNSKLKKPKWRF